MMSFRPATPRKSRWVVAAALLVSALVPLAAQAAPKSAPGPGCGVTPEKCYEFGMSVAGSPGPGDNATYTGTLKNKSSGGPGLTLGSANITWSPSNAFHSVTPGSVTVAPSSSSTPPTLAYNSGTRTLELRNLNAAPEATVTFTFNALALRSVNVTWFSHAKQANQFFGVGNDLTQVNASPTTSVSGSCSGDVPYNAYGCAGFPISEGATVCTGELDDQGDPSQVTSCITFPPVPGASGIQLMALRSYLGVDECPVLLECSYTVQLLNKLDPAYAGAFSASTTVDCGDLCGTVPVLFQQEESTGTTAPLLPCVVQEAPELVGAGALPNPLTGTTTCFTDNGDGTFTVENITFLNDYKVMGFTI